MKIVWKIILSVTVLITLWFMGKSSAGLFRYYELSEEALAVVDRWEIRQSAASKFIFEVSYHFTVRGQRYERQELLLSRVYPNIWAAKGDLGSLEKSQWWVYYSAGNPLKCSLERPFPLKNSIYALLSLGIFFYFLWLYYRYANEG